MQGVQNGSDESRRVLEVPVVDAGVADVPCAGMGEPDHHPHGGRLAGAVGTDEAGDAAGSHREGHVVDGEAVPVSLGECCDRDHRGGSIPVTG
jgi:hypothetical protein